MHKIFRINYLHKYSCFAGLAFRNSEKDIAGVIKFGENETYQRNKKDSLFSSAILSFYSSAYLIDPHYAGIINQGFIPVTSIVLGILTHEFYRT